MTGLWWDLMTRCIGAMVVAGNMCAVPALRAQVPDDSAVRVVRDAGTDRLLPWRAREEWRRGGADDDDLSLSSVHARDLTPGDAASVYVLDELGKWVVRLSSEGTVLDSMGGAGAGPGELLQPSALALDPFGNPSAFDRSKGAFVRWAREGGEPLQQVRVGAFVFGPGAALVPEGVVYRSMRPVGGGSVRYGLSLSESEAGRVRVLVTGPPIESSSADYPTCGATGIMSPVLFAPSLPWHVFDGTIAVVPGYDYRVKVFKDGVERFRIERDVPIRETTHGLALAELAGGWKVNDCVVPPDEALRGMGLAPTVPAVSDVRIDPTGRIWALRTAVADERRVIDVFSADGVYLGTLPLGFPFPSVFTSDSTFLSIDKDDLDVPILISYALGR